MRARAIILAPNAQNPIHNCTLSFLQNKPKQVQIKHATLLFLKQTGYQPLQIALRGDNFSE
jgi:hypothetical protein